MHTTYRTIRRGLLAGVLTLAAAQLVPVSRDNPPVSNEITAPDSVMRVLRRACYDCHSNETRWPWYSRLAPSSWLVARHVKRGRGDLNFSRWPALDFETLDDNFRAIEKQVAGGNMPLRSYTWIHRDARLSAGDRRLLIAWVRSQRIDVPLGGP